MLIVRQNAVVDDRISGERKTESPGCLTLIYRDAGTRTDKQLGDEPNKHGRRNMTPFSFL